MTDTQKDWMRARDALVAAVTKLGFPEELGNEIAKMLGSPKAMERMQGYLYHVKPDRAELIVDEALAISSDISRWHEKKDAEEANARYNEILWHGFGAEEE